MKNEAISGIVYNVFGDVIDRNRATKSYTHVFSEGRHHELRLLHCIRHCVAPGFIAMICERAQGVYRGLVAAESNLHHAEHHSTKTSGQPFAIDDDAQDDNGVEQADVFLSFFRGLLKRYGMEIF